MQKSVYTMQNKGNYLPFSSPEEAIKLSKNLKLIILRIACYSVFTIVKVIVETVNAIN
jgi:hypothetical protein